MTRFRGAWFVAITVLLGLSSTVQAQVPNGPCKPAFDAMLKEAATPHHAVTTRNGGAPSELISTADTTYVKSRGQWRRSPMTPKDELARQQENIRTVTKSACTALPDEIIDGKPASVYHTHYEQSEVGASDAKIWIAKTTGLPLRIDVSLEANEKTNVSTRFDYDHISAPAVK